METSLLEWAPDQHGGYKLKNAKGVSNQEKKRLESKLRKEMQTLEIGCELVIDDIVFRVAEIGDVTQGNKRTFFLEPIFKPSSMETKKTEKSLQRRSDPGNNHTTPKNSDSVRKANSLTKRVPLEAEWIVEYFRALESLREASRLEPYAEECYNMAIQEVESAAFRDVEKFARLTFAGQLMSFVLNNNSHHSETKNLALLSVVSQLLKESGGIEKSLFGRLREMVPIFK